MSTPSPQRIEARTAEIGGTLPVNRVLPTRQRRQIGAWCFLDHAGPARFESGEGMHVGAHPHTCLQTFTWMIEGDVLHRDSLGNEQLIRPGEVNLMTAGRGISHTEDSTDATDRLHAAQLWIALPPHMANAAPAFTHYPDLPTWQQSGIDFTLLVGDFAGHTSPVEVYSPLLGLDIHSPNGGECELTLNPAFEHGLLVMEGELELDGERFAENELAALDPGTIASTSTLHLTLTPGSRLILIGGAPAEKVLMFWNFVGYSREYIIEATREWQAESVRFGKVAGFDGERLVAPALPWRSG